jgi:Sfi1 spindle body protein
VVHTNPLQPRPRSVIERSLNDFVPQIPLQREADFSISFDDDPRRYTILRQFWHAWRAKTLRRRSRLTALRDIADSHYRHILVPLTFATWKEKWYYFAILHRRVERDRKRSIVTRCLDWWRYRAQFSLKRNRRIHNEVVLRRMFKAWLEEVRLRRDQLNSVTLQNVMELWKLKASTKQDLRATAEQWNRRRMLRQFWKEWFFQTCSVKTVQYYQIKLQQRSLGQWILKMRHLHEKQRRALFVARRRIIASAWTRWESSTYSVLEKVERADQDWKLRTLSLSLATWRRTQKLSLRAGLLRDKIDNRLIRRAWDRWREITYLILPPFPAKM